MTTTDLTPTVTPALPLGQMVLSRDGQRRVQFAHVRPEPGVDCLRMTVTAPGPTAEPMIIMIRLGPGHSTGFLRRFDGACAKVWPMWRSPLREDARERPANGVAPDRAAEDVDAVKAPPAPAQAQHEPIRHRTAAPTYTPGCPWTSNRFASPPRVTP